MPTDEFEPENLALDIQDLHVKPYLGDNSAEREWSQQPKPTYLFLHTPSYATLAAPHCLFLLGRRGSGKTWMLRMLQYQIETRAEPRYTYASLIEPLDVLPAVTTCMRLSLGDLSSTELHSLLMAKWEWVITTSAMCAVLSGRHDACPDCDLNTIRAYATAVGMVPSSSFPSAPPKSPVAVFLDVLNRELQQITWAPGEVARVVTNLYQHLRTPQFEAARDALTRVLNATGPCAVLVDSLERYELEESVAKEAVSALIDTAVRFYNKWSERKIIVKLALPTEVFNRLLILNMDKLIGRHIFIHWRYHELVRLVAKRYFCFVSGSENGDDYAIYDDYKKAQRLIHEHLPAVVTSKRGIEMDSLAYVMRHMQMKPRQIILLLNYVLALAERRGVSTVRLDSRTIWDGVHAGALALASAMVNLYNQVYGRELRELISAALRGCRSYFPEAELAQHVNRASKVRRETTVTHRELRRILLESGVLGKKEAEHALRAPEGKSIMLGLFEYQVDREVELGGNDTVVVHPMFYPLLNVQVSRNKMVYPRPAEDEEREVLRSTGICLGE